MLRLPRSFHEWGGTTGNDGRWFPVRVLASRSIGCWQSNSACTNAAPDPKPRRLGSSKRDHEAGRPYFRTFFFSFRLDSVPSSRAPFFLILLNPRWPVPVNETPRDSGTHNFPKREVYFVSSMNPGTRYECECGIFSRVSAGPVPFFTMLYITSLSIESYRVCKPTSVIWTSFVVPKKKGGTCG